MERGKNKTQETAAAFAMYKDMVYRLAYNRCCNKAESEDILSEVFLKYLEKSPEFKSEEHRKAWLITVTINTTKSLLRHPWRIKRGELFDLGYNEDFDENDLDLLHAVSRLPKNQRTAIHLFYYEEYSIEDIASLMNANQNTVKSWLRRAKQRLREELKEDDFE